MAAGKLNLLAEQGATYTKTLQWLESDGSTPIDITSYTITMQVRKGPDKPAIFDLTSVDVSGSRIIKTDAVNGTFQIYITSTDTTAQSPQNYKYDLLMNDGTDITRLVEGSFVLDARITQ